MQFPTMRRGSNKWKLILPIFVIVVLSLANHNLIIKTTISAVSEKIATEDEEGKLLLQKVAPLSSTSTSTSWYKGYIPASVEKYILDHAVELGFDSDKNPSGCKIWRDPEATNEDVHHQLLDYMKELDGHTAAVQKFEPIPDLLPEIIKTGNNDVCTKARPHPDGLKALFPGNQLSLSRSGYIEPLTTPMRSHSYCFRPRELMNLDYLVHDFERMCRDLKPTSKRILIDMGASLEFKHAGSRGSPIIKLIELYEKFGFQFDHIYGFEVTFNKPHEVFHELLPEKYLPAYHWINTGVNETKGAKMNPLNSIISKFDEDDLIVVKLDVDTPSVEMPLAHQLLEGGEDGIYHRLVDQFYFENHVHIGEMARWWTRSMNGTIKDSFDLFYGLREKGIPAHFWP